MTGNERVGVAMVIETLGRGGAERILVSLANGLDRERFDVHVVAIHEPGELAGELAPEVTVHALRRHQPWDVRSIPRFGRLLEDNDLRIVHTHSHMAAYFARIGLWTGGRCFHVVHDHYPLIASSRLRFADRLLLRNVDYWFATSKELERYATRWLGVRPNRCETLANGIDGLPEPGMEKDQVFTIVQVARVVPQKDHAMALQVAARLRERLPSFRWVMVGRADSAHAQACKEQAERLGLTGSVEFVGEQADVASILSRAHVGALTSRAEGLPLALLEYMAAGLPVVVTDVGDAGLVAREGGGGRAIASGDVDGFADALLRYATDADASLAAGAANRRYVAGTYSVEAMVRRVEEVYETLIGKPVAATDGEA
jgi:glycosyltransferase involved in cell wall biosynthesis